MSYIGKKNGNPNTDFLEAGGELENHDLVNVDSNGNLGIKTSSPAEELHLAASLPTIRLEDTDNNYYSHVYSQNGDLILSSDQANANSGSAMRFEVDTTERMRIDSSGNLGIGTSSPSAKLDVVGDIEVSGGVYVGGTGSANYLDDYEEGTWTPTLDGSTATPTVSYGTQTKGSYTKIGNLVHARGTLQISSRTGGSGSAIIEGLPFNVSSSIDTYAMRSGGVVISQADSFTSGNYPSTGQVATTSNVFYLRQIDHSSGTTTIYVSAFQTNTLVRFSVTYFTDS